MLIYTGSARRTRRETATFNTMLTKTTKTYKIIKPNKKLSSCFCEAREMFLPKEIDSEPVQSL